MIQLRDDVIEMLRRMARRAKRPSVMLRAVVKEVGPKADRPLLVLYFEEAFCFRDGQGFKIFGWFPNGSEGLKDSDIDALLSGPIAETRAEWDRPVAGVAGSGAHAIS